MGQNGHGATSSTKLTYTSVYSYTSDRAGSGASGVGMSARRIIVSSVLLGASFASACSSEADGGPTIEFATAGPIAGPAGAGHFTFGAATAAMQIEENQPQADWHVFTAPTAQGGLARGTFVGDAVLGVANAQSDIALLVETGLDAYRFNPSWPRIQPTKDGVYDESALAHYDTFIDSLVAAGIKPVVTLHHFSSPIWVDDPRNTDATPCVPSPTDLCGWDSDDGAMQIIAEMVEYAGMLARRYGDRVDEWGTLNEPVNYLFASYGAGVFPPGKSLAFGNPDALLRAYKNYMRAHIAIYDAIKANDSGDADGDGTDAWVGLSLNHNAWVASRQRSASSDPVDLSARDRLEYAYHRLFVDAALTGAIDTNFDGTVDETLAGPSASTPKLDWLGVQYYARIGVTGQYQVNDLFSFQPCFPPFLTAACLDPVDTTHCVPRMAYEYYEEGLYEVLVDYHQRYPNLPLTVTESGIATEVERRRSEHIVRSLEQIARARAEGVDVRGYYHWSLVDNFEWASGFVPRFGLYSVDRTAPGYPRTATEGAKTLRSIATSRRLTSTMRGRLGGTSPMTPETIDDPSFDAISCRPL